MKKEDKAVYYTTVTLKGIKFNIYATANGICRIDLNKTIESRNTSKRQKTVLKKTKLYEDDPYFFGVVNQLKEYFAGKRKSFDVPLDLTGTEFQLKVWKELQNIPYGETVSYKEIALRLGNAKLVRAIGITNGTNPIPIIIPCHRVIYSSGQLGGYSAGVDIKIKLLETEGCLPLELFE
jgi:O-6-methylguanine DNA methyltransferase